VTVSRGICAAACCTNRGLNARVWAGCPRRRPGGGPNHQKHSSFRWPQRRSFGARVGSVQPSSWEPIFFRDTALSRKQLALESEAWSFGKSDACRSFFMRRSTAASGSQSLRANVDCLSAILPAHSKSPSVYLHTSGSFGIASIPSPVILLLTALRLINSPANEFGASS
jgi:hypothetical protein